MRKIVLLALLLTFIGKSNAQNWLTAGNPLGAAGVLGGTSGHYDVQFWANGFQYMDLQWNTGYFGLGTSSPAHLLDVSGGDIDISTSTRTYMISGNPVLWHNGITSNIFVGVGAGNTTAGLIGNVYMGFQAGNHSSGSSINSVLIGDSAGYANGANGATFVGYDAGIRSAASADFPTYVGYLSGYHESGSYNAFLGANSGYYSVVSANTYIGSGSGCTQADSLGSLNVTLGYQSKTGGTGSNEIAIGANALATVANTMALGGATTGGSAYATWVGIGLSGDAPHWPLEINAVTKTNTVMTDSSGLKFRQLTSSYSPTVATHKFLTVNQYGDVVLDNIDSVPAYTYAWTLKGNAGTSPGTNFIGTTDNEDLIFKVNNILSGEINQASGNTAFGFNDLGSNNSTAIDNTAMGYNALQDNTYASRNTAIGYEALYHQAFGTSAWNCENTAIGALALFSNIPTSTTNGYQNTAIGYEASYFNSIGLQNTSVGLQAGIANTTGNYNTCVGYGANYENVSGSGNTAIGYSALFGTGSYSATGNTAVGDSAGYDNNTGTYNTYVGYKSGASGNYTNSTAIGNGAVVNASNKIVIGNTSVSLIGGYQGWTTYVSDKRFKKNIQHDVHGLDFILKLQPVTYNMDIKKLNTLLTRTITKDSAGKTETISIAPKYDSACIKKEAIRYNGFLAQDVERVADSLGYSFSGVVRPANDNDTYKMTYSDFVVPIVKAIQEQQGIINSQAKEIADLKTQMVAMQKAIADLGNKK